MTLKIALLGSAPSSVALAPYKDPSWQIWGCSPGAYGYLIQAGRVPDAWFELHRWEPDKPWFSPEYRGWMASLPCVYMAEKRPEIPGSRALPWEDLVKRWGPYWFNSSLSWMAAMAMDAGAKVMGMWGVDMSATEEYGFQRAGCQRMIEIAMGRGIEFHLPPESDLLRPPPLYGICELDHAWIKMLARKGELTSRMAAVAAENTRTLNEHMFLKGAVDDLEYMMNTWAGPIGPVMSQAKLETPVLTPEVPDAAKGNGDARPSDQVLAASHEAHERPG